MAVHLQYMMILFCSSKSRNRRKKGGADPARDVEIVDPEQSDDQAACNISVQVSSYFF